ncbi:hypothetical protein JTB14_018945 [Gonioctena quinquepunctata]|nr:hypothetical protein JTB14_018945 [Gonioctena quinquepunctata]
MMWNLRKDCFTFKLKFHKISKEILEVLKTVMSVFDPISILSPIIVKVKILLQNIRRAGLINRTKWNKTDSNIQIGEIVVINENNVPREIWPMGVIEKVYKGQDGVIRVVDVRISREIFKRPERKIHRLNISIDERRVNTRGDNVAENTLCIDSYD